MLHHIDVDFNILNVIFFLLFIEHLQNATILISLAFQKKMLKRHNKYLFFAKISVLDLFSMQVQNTKFAKISFLQLLQHTHLIC